MPHTALKDLMQSTGAKEEEHKKDKLAEQKQNERDIKEAEKKKKQEAKEHKHEEHLAEAHVHRMEREYNAENGVESKRAAKDARDEKKHQEKKDEGFTCEHGVYKCRICHPVIKHK